LGLYEIKDVGRQEVSLPCPAFSGQALYSRCRHVLSVNPPNNPNKYLFTVYSSELRGLELRDPHRETLQHGPRLCAQGGEQKSGFVSLLGFSAGEKSLSTTGVHTLLVPDIS
jgi:hypothetical protein